MGWLIGLVIIVIVAVIILGVYLLVVYFEAKDDARYSNGYMNRFGGFVAQVYDAGYVTKARQDALIAENAKRNRERRGE